MFSKQQSSWPAGISELKEAIGSVFFAWASVENALQKSINALESPKTGTRVRSISGSIKRFKNLHHSAADGREIHIDLTNLVVQILFDALEDRNLIAHGLCGWQASPVSNPAEAHIIARLDNGEKEISLAQLHTTAERLNSIASDMGNITYAALHPEKVGISNIYADISGYLRNQ